MSEVKDLLNEIDKQIEEDVHFPEFILLYERKREQLSTNHGSRIAFRMFDREEKGFINAEDVVFTMNQLGSPIEKEKAEKLIRETSLYGYNKINFEEFLTMQLF
jgi:Ca2+-binding EF-hand superfamily protein